MAHLRKPEAEWLTTTGRSLCRRLRGLTYATTVGSAVEAMRLNGLTEMPIVHGDFVVGKATLAELSDLASTDIGDDPENLRHRAIGEVLPRESLNGYTGAMLHIDSPIAAIAMYFQEDPNLQVMPLLGEGNIYLGVAMRADVIASRLQTLAPPRMGGMATPLGVYLTDGINSGGAGDLGLFLTGATLGLLGIIASVIMVVGSDRLTGHIRFAPVLHLLHIHYDWNSQIGTMVTSDLASLLAMPLVLVMLRAIPLAGYHAAEHQVVHCVERGEPLDPETVRLMPRVHPRCGTNIVAAIGVFSLALCIGLVAMGSVVGAVAPALVATLFLWKPVGSFFQDVFTTRPATDKQIRSGIKAANDLMRKYRQNADVKTRINTRIWRMGLIQTMLGVLAISAIAALIAYLVPALKPFLPTLN